MSNLNYLPKSTFLLLFLFYLSFLLMYFLLSVFIPLSASVHHLLNLLFGDFAFVFASLNSSELLFNASCLLRLLAVLSWFFLPEGDNSLFLGMSRSPLRRPFTIEHEVWLRFGFYNILKCDILPWKTGISAATCSSSFLWISAGSYKSSMQAYRKHRTCWLEVTSHQLWI